ncbi:hypothetical protein KC460_04435 [Candidatus Dependentiae bacterium]|nr:hypothetical protein [Candidatus Dependentiae bacterium]
MKNSYFKVFGLGLVLLIATSNSTVLANTLEEIAGENIPGYVNTKIDDLFSYHKRNNSSVTEAKERVIRNLRDTDCAGCTFIRTNVSLNNCWYRNTKADVRVCTKAGIRLMIKKEIIKQIEADAWSHAAKLSIDSGTASIIAKNIAKEAQSLLNSAHGDGILDEFVGQTLANKVTRYYSNTQRLSTEKIEKNNEEKIKELADHYFYGSNEIGNISAIINKAKERAGSQNLDDTQINNLFLDAFQEFTISTTRNKSKSSYTPMRTDKIVERMRTQVGRRTDRLRKSSAFSHKTKGQLKDYIGQKLEGEIESINRDLGR